MSVKQLNPSLAFDGTAEKAIKLYVAALGAKVEALMRFGEAAAMGQPPCPLQHKERIMHSLLRIDDGVLMVMDAPPGVTVSTTSNVQVVLDFDDAADMTKRFDALAVGGRVTLPIHDAFWGSKFGMLSDAFGVTWMFGCDLKNP